MSVESNDKITTISKIIEDKGTAVSTISPDEMAVEAARIMAEERIGVLICCDDPTVVSGVISERDLVRAFAHQSAQIPDLTVRELMTSDVTTCHSTDDVTTAMHRMKQGKFRHIPVVDDGRLRGIVSVTDILNYYVRNIDQADRQKIIELVFSSGLVYPGG